MEAIVSVLDQQQYDIYWEIAAEMVRRFDLEIKNDLNLPHFSYHVAERYEADRLLPLMGKMARQTEPFPIQVAGLGLFVSSEPIIYALVVRTRPLSKWHQKLWDVVEPLAQGANLYYSSENWIPHITLSNGMMTLEKLPGAIRWLSQLDFHHDVFIDNITYVPSGENQTYREPVRFSLAR